MGSCSSTSAIQPRVNRAANRDTSVEVFSRKEEPSLVDDCPQSSKDESHKSVADSEWSSEEKLFKYSDETHNIVYVETSRDTSEDVDELEEEEDMFWIPATLASHMGVRCRSLYPVTEDRKPRDRVYTDDADLFMSVETNRRRSYLLIGDLVNKPQPVEMSVKNSFVNNNTPDLISLGRN